jgi:hypothetical protein
VNLHWFESIDFTSFDGVEATVFPPTDKQQVENGPCDWALHTRTRSSASSGDRHQQNETIRLARKQFGGKFYNDWHGRNRYPGLAKSRTIPAPHAGGLGLGLRRDGKNEGRGGAGKTEWWGGQGREGGRQFFPHGISPSFV